MNDTSEHPTGGKPLDSDAIMTREGSSRLRIYLLLAFTPIIIILTAGFFLAGRSVHQKHESMRENGRITAGVVRGREAIRIKSGYRYTVDYNFDAFDPEYQKTTSFPDDDQVSCEQYNMLRKGAAVRVVYDMQQPTEAKLDLDHTFRSGMSETDFNDWRSSKWRDADPNCYPAR